MAQFSTTLTIGKQDVTVTTDSFEELVKQVAYLTDLTRDAYKVDDAEFYFRVTNDGDEYMGLQRFRKAEGSTKWEKQEVQFRKIKKPKDQSMNLFTYDKASDQYAEKGGWRYYNRETEQSEPRNR